MLSLKKQVAIFEVPFTFTSPSLEIFDCTQSEFKPVRVLGLLCSNQVKRLGYSKDQVQVTNLLDIDIRY